MPVKFLLASSSSVVFNRTDDIMTENGALTIACNIFPLSTGPGNAGRIIARDVSSVNGVFLFMGTTSTIRFTAISSTGGTSMNRTAASNSVVFNAWNHVVVTWDGSTTATNIKFYVNGVETSYGNTVNGVGLANNNTGLLSIGNRTTNNNDRSFDGSISDVALWSDVLTLDEIKILAGSKTRYVPLQVRPGSLKRYFPLDEFPDGASVTGTHVVRDRSPLFVTGSGSFSTGGAVPTMIAEQVISYP